MSPSDSASELVLRSFPRLRGRSWRVTSPETAAYNCVAWANHDETRWWWPSSGYYWPTNAPTVLSIEAFVTIFVAAGFSLAESGELEPGYLKVAIFATDLGPSHVARQLPGGDWTSKLGSSVDVLHPLTALEGTLYGRVVQFMRKPVSP